MTENGHVRFGGGPTEKDRPHGRYLAGGLPYLSVEDVHLQLMEFPELTNVVAIFRRVTEKRLRVFELAAELLDENGEADVETAAIRQPEVNLTLAEVESRIRAARQATDALLNLPPR